MENLLIEICTEELPAGYLQPALDAFSSRLLQQLDDAKIGHGAARTFGTPRRLAVIVENVAPKQQSLRTEITGPPAKVGFDKDGNLTVAGQKFAEKIGIPASRLKIKETRKGSYLCATRTIRGLSTKNILAGLLPDLILSIPFPKTMRWADLSIVFARPIQSVLALLGNRSVTFSIGSTKTGRFTLGHRFLHPGRIKIDHPDGYIEALRRAHVLVDSAERKKAVENQITKIAGSLGGRVLPDGELVDIVTNLVENPFTVAGSFDKKFLELPDEVLITAMREHQKYFAVIDGNERLMPFFVAVNNTLARDMDLVAKGHERVLRARLEDARFFFQSDLKTPIKDRVERLKGVMFQAELGTMREKTGRVAKLAEFIAGKIDPGLSDDVSRAAQICKADLVSQVVVEFPKLQGVMGRIYATRADEPERVASAIEEHYRPTRSGGKLPETIAGAILAVADKIDSICGCFAVGLIPTGASDPYALRRQGIGIVLTMLDKDFTFSLSELIHTNITLFEEKKSRGLKPAADKVYAFFRDRMVHLLAEEGYSRDVIAAIVNVSVDHVPNVWERVGALEKLKRMPDFEPLAVSFKRVVNIIKQAQGRASVQNTGDVNPDLFQHSSESNLYSTFRTVRQKASENLDAGSFREALLDIASLRDSIDAFFDGVMIMAEDAAIRENRLALLGEIAAFFGVFADFSKIST